MAAVARRRPAIVGSPETVRAGLDDLAREYSADEVMIVTITYDHAARRRSYELIAAACGLRTSGPAAPAPSTAATGRSAGER